MLTYLVASTLRLKTEEKQQLLETGRRRAAAAGDGGDPEPRARGVRARLEDPVAGRVRDGEDAARVLPAPADEGDPGRARRERPRAGRARGAADADRRGEPARGGAEGGEPRAVTPREAARRRRPSTASSAPTSTGSSPSRGTQTTADNLDLEQARKVLDADHYDLEKIKERILESLAVGKLKGDVSGQILCFVGPPGVGKTSLGHSIATALGRKFVRISVGGVRDESELRGHRRTYIGAMPGTIIRALRDAESRNPVFMIDEIDKMGADWRGDPASAMLEILDPAAEHDLPRPLPRPAVRPLEGPVRLHGQPARDDPGAADRPDGRDPAHGLHRGREAPDRQALSRAEAARGARARPGEDHGRRSGAADDHPRVHARGGRPQPRAADRRPLPQGGAQGRRRLQPQAEGRREARPRVARATPLRRRGPQADLRPGCRDRPRRHGRRRRRPLHRGHRVRRHRPADRHRPARRGDAGVGARRALVGAQPRRAPRDRPRLVLGPRRPRPRPGRSGAEGRARRRGSRSRPRSSRSRAASRCRATSR